MTTQRQKGHQGKLAVLQQEQPHKYPYNSLRNKWWAGVQDNDKVQACVAKSHAKYMHLTTARLICHQIAQVPPIFGHDNQEGLRGLHPVIQPIVRPPPNPPARPELSVPVQQLDRIEVAVKEAIEEQVVVQPVNEQRPAVEEQPIKEQAVVKPIEGRHSLCHLPPLASLQMNWVPCHQHQQVMLEGRDGQRPSSG